MLGMQMTVSQGVRAEILALGRKVTMVLALGHYSVMEIETFSASPLARKVILQQRLKSTAAAGPVSPVQKLPVQANIFSLSSTESHQWFFSPSPALEKSCIKCRFSIPIF